MSEAVESLLSKILFQQAKTTEQQMKTNELLLTLIEALSEDQGIDEDQQPVRHLDGTLA